MKTDSKHLEALLNYFNFANVTVIDFELQFSTMLQVHYQMHQSSVFSKCITDLNNVKVKELILKTIEHIQDSSSCERVMFQLLMIDHTQKW